MKHFKFLFKVVIIVISSIIILFFINLWIIKPLTKYEKKSSTEHKYYNNKFSEKEKIHINYKEAENYIGKYVIVKGKIVATYNNGKVCYLNFDKNYKKYLTLIIFSGDFHKFPKNPEKYYFGKIVEVEGRIKTYRGRLEIILSSKDQIKIIE